MEGWRMSRWWGQLCYFGRDFWIVKIILSILLYWWIGGLWIGGLVGWWVGALFLFHFVKVPSCFCDVGNNFFIRFSTFICMFIQFNGLALNFFMFRSKFCDLIWEAHHILHYRSAVVWCAITGQAIFTSNSTTICLYEFVCRCQIFCKTDKVIQLLKSKLNILRLS